jgi:hypothetical protein
MQSHTDCLLQFCFDDLAVTRITEGADSETGHAGIPPRGALDEIWGQEVVKEGGMLPLCSFN